MFSRNQVSVNRMFNTLCMEITATSCVTVVAFIIIHGISEYNKDLTNSGGTEIRQRVSLFFLGRNIDLHPCEKQKGTMGAAQPKVLCQSSDSFWVRVTADDLTDKQCCPSLSEPVDNNSMSRVTSHVLSAYLLLCLAFVTYWHVLFLLFLPWSWALTPFSHFCFPSFF